jgi:hypothetical protein
VVEQRFEWPTGGPYIPSAIAKKYTSPMGYLRYRVRRLETDCLTAEYSMDSLGRRFESTERRRDEEMNELNSTIKELQDGMISLKRGFRETADYVDGKLEKAPKLRKCAHICIEEECWKGEVGKKHTQMEDFTRGSEYDCIVVY